MHLDADDGTGGGLGVAARAPDASPEPPTAVTTPGGTPYHRLALDRRHGWWQPLLGAVLILVPGLVVIPLALIVVYVLPAYLLGAATSVERFPEFGTPLAGEAHRLLVLVCLLPVVCRVAGWVRQRPAGTLISVAGGFRWRWLAASLVPAVSAVLLTMTANRLVTDAPGDVTARWSHWVGLPSFLLAATVYAVLVPLHAACVELLRGWVLQSAGAWLRSPWLPIAVGAAAVGAVTFALGGHPRLPEVLAGVVSGGMLGWLVVRTGGVEAAITYHAVSSLAASLFDAAVGYSARGVDPHGWLDLVFAATQVLVFVRLMRAFLACPPVAALLEQRRVTGWTDGAAAAEWTAARMGLPPGASAAHDTGRMATASTSIR